MLQVSHLGDLIINKMDIFYMISQKYLKKYI